MKLKNLFKSNKDSGQAAGPSTSRSQGVQHHSRSRGILSALRPGYEVEFNFKANKTSWPPVDLHDTGDSFLTPAGHLHLDFADGYIARWSHGKYNAPRFGEELIFPKHATKKESLGKDQLPPLLFDLQTRRVVTAAEVEPARYTFISHVWGHTVELDGSRFNLPWKIPIRSEAKLEQIFEAARVLVGERFIWMDVLCLDQREKNATQIGRMQSYLENSAGCLAWLDSEGVEASAWNEVLGAIAGVNEFFKLDRNGVPTIPSTKWQNRDMSASWNPPMCLKSLQRYKRIELAPWFKRVWTLQEGVVPDEMYFCTPERYVTGGFYLFSMMGIYEATARSLFDAGETLALAVNSELQSSELFKMRALRRLYRASGVSFWHLVHAVRSRSCTYEQDRVFGVLGLLKEHALVIDYHRSLSDIRDDLFKVCVNGGDFYACLFLGQAGPFPKADLCNGLLSSSPVERCKARSLSWTPHGVQMQDVGVTPVDDVWLVVSFGAMQVLNGMEPSVHELDIDTQRGIAKAFNVSTAVERGLCPGAFAGVKGVTSLRDGSDFLKSLGKDFTRIFEDNIAVGTHSWMGATSLFIGLTDYTLAVMWSQLNDPQLAVLTDIPGKPMRLIMHPSSTSGLCDGCIIATGQPDGSWRKIGIGLGRSLKASSTASFLLTNTISDQLVQLRRLRT